MPDGDGDHFDKDKEKRLGWWKKKEDGNPIPDYRASCSTGYKTAWWAAHHILPAVSIRQAADESNKDQGYIEDVQYITDWKINNSDNMIGLPVIFAYQFYYSGQSTIQSVSDRYAKWTAWVNRFAQATRQSWVQEIVSKSPEPYPIHNPTSWGHTVYNGEVKTEVKVQVWDMVDEERKKHHSDGTNVQSAMERLQGRWRTWLTTRGAPSAGGWVTCTTTRDMDALKPFTMHDVSRHPLFG